ncbi:MAG: hypothetical protein JKY93_07370 [Gammaproteobacteria bacterium]|nr:hypothetical protein [Gammaproteobacteria bacterium]
MTKWLSIILLCVFLATACSLADKSGKSISRDVERFLNSNQYAKATRLINRVQRNHPDYRMLQIVKKQIAVKKKKYESAAFNKSQVLIKKGAWKAALSLLETARKNVGKSHVLNRAYKRAHKKQQRLTDILLRDHSFNRAKWLIEELQVMTDVVRINPWNFSFKLKLDGLEKQARTQAGQLHVLAKAALKQNELSVAKRALNYALTLRPNTKSYLKTNQRILYKMKYGVGSTERIRQLQNRYKTALKNRSLVIARSALLSILGIDPGNKKAQRELRKVNALIKVEVKQLLSRAAAAYSHGKFKQAVTIWQKAELLDPDNQEIKDHLERASRVLKNLKSIRKKQTQ